MNEISESERGIAVIGIACRFPGADDLEAYRRLLTDGRLGIVSSSEAFLCANGIPEELFRHPHLINQFGVLAGIENFDAQFFGIPPARAAALDPQQRVLLELAVNALAHAGYKDESEAGSIGVYVSLAHCSYRSGLASDSAGGFFSLTASDKDYGATRISYALDLTGPSLNIQSAWSGSLAAVHMAVEALLSGQCDMALAGGASILLPQGAYLASPGLMLSTNGRCLPFDAEATGTIPGNGAGLVVLKRLDKARADGDTVHAVILGSAIANDGSRKVDYLAPGIRGQMRAVGEAWSVAGIDPASLGMIEAHGTGTRLGDPIEISALNKLFAHFAAEGNPPPALCRIGSVKANIGHLNVASGIAGFIKAVLAVRDGIIFGTPGFHSPNPDAPFADSPLCMSAEPVGWEGWRRAGVSSFGFGGTNVHVVLEQATETLCPIGQRQPLAEHRFTAERHWLDQYPSWPLGAVANDMQTLSAAKVSIPTPASQPIDLLAWLRQLFADVLQAPLESIAPDLTYDQLGIDSLLVVSLTGRIREYFPHVRGSLLFEQKTLHELANFLTDELATNPSTRSPVIETNAETNSENTTEPDTSPQSDTAVSAIAIIGMAGRFPGGESWTDLWELLKNGQTAISPVPDDRGWSSNTERTRHQAAFTERTRHQAAFTERTRHQAAFIENPYAFDAQFFGIAPAEARHIDPQARLFLETAWAALEDAGLTPAALKESARKALGNDADVGVFAGVMNMPYRLLAHAADAERKVVQANHWSVANRVSYHLDFTGPSLAVDTACSASLTALHLACESLRRGECAAALAGGVNLILDQVQQNELVLMGMLSPGDVCHSFGAKANGFVQGEGVGVAVLKPLANALADGDRILGIIRGSATNANGRTGGYTVPNPKAQATVIRHALKQAAVPLDSIGSIECHGTGTALGDPIEIAGLAEVFKQSYRNKIAIGSIKSNMGHLESAAGMAGLAKILLQFDRRSLLPSLNAEPTNPELHLERTGFRVQTHLSAWHPPVDATNHAYPRRAGLSGFGAGGANAHLVLEEAPPVAASDHPPRHRLQPIVLSASDNEALQRLLDQLIAHVNTNPTLAGNPAQLADMAYTLATGRVALAVRCGFAAYDRQSLLDGLADLANGNHPVCGDQALEQHFQQWRAGQAVDWASHWQGEPRHRLRLPTYPFAKHDLRLQVSEPSIPPTARFRSPWISATTAQSATSWRFMINADQPLLDQHKVDGKPYLPGMVSALLALAAADANEMPVIGVADVIWKTPVTLSREGLAVVLKLSGQRFSLGLTDAGDTMVEGRLLDAGQISPDERFMPTLEASVWQQTFTQAQVRERLVAAGLDHGPVLRAIVGLKMNEDSLSAELERPSAARQQLAAWNPCPSLLDSALQAACLLLLSGSEPVMPLPLGINRLIVFEQHWPERITVNARLKEKSPGYAQLDLTLSDAEGKTLCLMQGLMARLLNLNPARVPVPLFVPRWLALIHPPSAASEILTAGTLIIVSPQTDNPLLARLEQAISGRSFKHLTVDAILALPEEHFPENLVYIHPLEQQFSNPPNILMLLQILAVLSVASRPINLLLLTLNVHKTAGDEQTWPWAAAAMGLARTAMRENARLKVICLDLDDPQALASALKTHCDPLGLPLAWRNGRMLSLRLQDLAVTATPVPSPVNRDDHILIIGGAGGLGLALCERWGQRHGTRFTLIGRRSAADTSIQGAPLYLQADVTDAEALAAAIATAEARQGPITGAIHAALIMEDRAIRNMRPDDFLPAFEVKRLGLQNLSECLRDRPLRWLCLFSSVNSFIANAGQANYVSGCTVLDALGAYLDGRYDFPVRVVNWGYWGDIGRVATEDYRKRMARLGVHSIGVEEGFEALERILDGQAPQVLAIRAEAAVLEQLGLTTQIKPEAPTPEADIPASKDLFAAAKQAALTKTASDAANMLGVTADYAELDELAALSFAAWWASRDCPKIADRDALAQHLGLAADHRRQFDALLDMLTRRGFLHWDGEYARFDAYRLPDSQTLLARRNAFLARAAHFTAHFRLLDACIEAYADILAGKTAPTEVLFPDMSMSLVEGMYRGNRMVDHFNEKLATAAAAAQTANPGAVFKVLEFGSGTGGTSQRVLPALAAGADYDYTDISTGFLLHGKKQFKAAYPFVNFKLFNLENPPDPALFAPNSYDLAFGANVIHATQNMARSLRHVAGLIRPGGLLMLYEMVANHDFVTLTFGLLPGWWLAEDSRLPHSPLLSPDAWRCLLTENGFDEIGIYGQPEAKHETAATHALIVARRRQPAPAESGKRHGLLRGRLRKDVNTAPSTAAESNKGLEQAVLACVAATLELPPDKIDLDRGLADYGADSILGVQMVRNLNTRFGIALKPTTVFSHPSVRALTAYLSANHGLTSETTSDVTVPEQATPTAPTIPTELGDGIAIIGMAGRFPGADNVDEFEQLLLTGRSGVGPVPAERWDHTAIYDPRPLQAGRSVCGQGGFINDALCFDPVFFGLSPAEAVAMDPQQRLFLMAAWHALEDAGLPPESLNGLECGVYAGNVAGDYERLLEAAGQPQDARTFMGSAASMLPARIAYHLNLKGPAISIDTACSSSLVAITEACEALHGGRCDLALAGGVAAMFTPNFYIVASNAGMLSPTGQCHTLDAAADGFVPGEAVAVLVLKRLDKAVADNDRILGVIRGWGVNQDGASNGITAPSAPAQAALIRNVQQRFAINPSSIDYVELHGTGTRLGDPVEIEGLTGGFANVSGVCGIGSVKSNVGHTLAASGAVGLIKVLLALRAETLPPTVNFSQLNPDITLNGTPFYPVGEATAWPRTANKPRRAAVSAFGFAGTNAHLVVEEAPAIALSIEAQPQAPWLFVLSAKTETALQSRAAELACWLKNHTETELGLLAGTLATGRAHFEIRAALIAGDRQTLLAGLDAIAAGRLTTLVSENSSLAVAANAYLQGDNEAVRHLWPKARLKPLPLPGYPFEKRLCRPALAGHTISARTPEKPFSEPNPAAKSILLNITEHLDLLSMNNAES